MPLNIKCLGLGRHDLRRKSAQCVASWPSSCTGSPMNDLAMQPGLVKILQKYKSFFYCRAVAVQA